MKSSDRTKATAIIEKPVDNRQVHIIVDGCKVKLNFPASPENTAINDVKRMMLGGVIKK